MSNKLEKILFIPDTHVPYHDKKAWNVMMKAAKDLKPDHVIILGDFIDNYSVSSHSKDPNRALKLDEEVNESIKLLKELKSLKAKNNVYVEGNHEDRLERYLMEKAPELFNVVKIPKLLKLDELGFKHTPYKSHYILGKLHITHDCGTAGRYAHYKSVDTFQKNVVIGHTHRLGFAVEGNANGERHATAMLGWLGDVNKVDYMHKIKATRDWTLGFGIGYLDKKTNYVYIVPIPIVNYTAVVNGKLYK